MQLNPLLRCGFKPTDIVSFLKTYDLRKDSERTKGLKDVLKLEELIQLGFTPSFVIKGISEKKNVNEILELLPSLMKLGYTSKEVVGAVEKTSSYKYELLLPQLVKGT